MPLIVTKPLQVTQKFNGSKLTLAVGSVVELQPTGLLWGLRPNAIKCKLFIPDDIREVNALLPEAKQVFDHTQDEATKRVLTALENVTDLPRVDTKSLQRVAYDLGNDRQYPYLHNTYWMKQVNREVRHPTLMIEKIKMSDGWHLAVVMYTSW